MTLQVLVSPIWMCLPYCLKNPSCFTEEFTNVHNYEMILHQQYLQPVVPVAEAIKCT